jgi:hemerythrin superfamily protein
MIMKNELAVVTAPVRDRFLADHRRLESLLEELLAAVEANDRPEMSRLWGELESGLLAHLEAEETHMFPALLRVSERNARFLVQEHQHIRRRLAELGVAVDLHSVRLDSVRDFIHELRAHAASEDQLLYKWADTHLDEPHRASIIEALTAGIRAFAKKSMPG